MADEKRVQEVLTRVNEWRDDGHGYAYWPYLAKLDPDYVEALNALSKCTLSREDVLPMKTKQIIMSALLANRHSERLGAHLHRAMDSGATEAELLATFEVSLMITGAPTLLFGVATLSRVVEERKAAGKTV